MGIMAISCGSWEGFKRYFILCLTATLFGMAAVNILLLTNIPLVFKGLNHMDDLGGNVYHYLNTIASYTGIPDFLLWEPSMEQPQTSSYLGLVIFLFLLRYAGKSFVSALPVAKPFLASLFVIPVAAIAYYHFRGNGSYQIVRFEEIGHLYLLAMAGFAFSSIYEKSSKKILTTCAVVLFLILPEVGMRAFAVKQVVSVDHYFGTEFRDAEALVGGQKNRSLAESHKRSRCKPCCLLFWSRRWRRLCRRVCVVKKFPLFACKRKHIGIPV